MSKCRGWKIRALLLLLAVVLGAGRAVGLGVSLGVGQGRIPAPQVDALGAVVAGATTAAEGGVGASCLHGAVLDLSGALIPNASVLLQRPGQVESWRTVSDSEGRFYFGGLSPGQYQYKVEVPGFALFESPLLSLHAGENRMLEPAALDVLAGHAEAFVTMGRKEMAAADLHAAEQQRILGFPDFYTSFVWHAASLNAKQKLGLGLRATTDRMAFVTAGMVASAEQMHGTFPGYGGGPEGFARRYGAAYGDGFIGKLLGGAVFPSIFRQDPRYFYMGSHGTVRQRVRHAVASGFMARSDNGRLQLNVSHMLGNAAAGALSMVYHPKSDSAVKLVLYNALLGTVGEAGVNVARELLLKRFVRGGDVAAGGMP